MTDKQPAQEIYEIKVSGHLDPKWTDWFNGFSIVLQANAETLLSGTVEDQAALHELLVKIRDLGLPLLSVNQITNGINQ